MNNRVFNEKVIGQLQQLERKYDAMGQDLSSYLEGLLHADYLTYWDYVHLDTLLSLQTPKTHFPDEKVFIIYHQITELYFNLIIHEQEQLIYEDEPLPDQFLKRITRINRYFDHLIDSFDVMVNGMDPDQFLRFRMSLLPSSGFQSAQYRKIEINATNFINLVPQHLRGSVDTESISELYDLLYWKQGATELATGKKTLTLRQFEAKYSSEFIRQGEELKDKNILVQYAKHHEGNESLREALRGFDHRANVLWPLAHYRSTVRYLQKDPKEIQATGGTNWQKYLPPKNQGIRFYPDLWSGEEIEDWGKNTNRELS
ncbi:MAG: tryptophan 2,3-dioxygenase family protein [Bacteroidota bacterium]